MAETWTVRKVLDWTIDYFASRNIPEHRLSAELLLAAVLNCKRIEIYLQFERILSARERSLYREYIQRRIEREPVQYILGETEFMGLPFKVAPPVLIPRPDTELLVDCVIEYFREHLPPPLRILEIGTGSGCIAISIAKHLPGAEVWAIEKNLAAMEIARENAAWNEVPLHFVEGDFFQVYFQIPEKFDIIVSNPPYVSENDWLKLEPEVREHEPREALLAGKDGLDFYRHMIPLLGKLLKHPGMVFLETGYQQARAVAELLQPLSAKIEIKKDYRQIERLVIASVGS